MAYFTSLFILNHPDIVANKFARFTKFLKCTADGTLFERPAVRPLYVAHIEYHSPPIWGKLQSSYDDVEAELKVMRDAHPDKFILFVGGDGLSVMRLNHLLYKHPDQYLDLAPMIVPIQGESPHGVYHVMHGGWRLFWPFMKVAAQATLDASAGVI